jgi:WD40 repeat protein
METYLDGLPKSQQCEGLVVLLAIELNARRWLGEQPGAGEYRKRFPEWVEVVDVLLGETAVPTGPINRLSAIGATSPAGSQPTLATTGMNPPPCPHQPSPHSPPSATQDPSGLDGDPASPDPAHSPSASFTLARRDTADSATCSDAATEMHPRESGLRHLGDYELLGEIARGGMGVVYRARQHRLNRLVALKIIRDGAMAGPSEIRRFRTEAEAVAQLDHPHIVPIYEVGQSQDQPYFSMKLIEGGNLTGHLDHLKYNHRKAATLMSKVALAVDYAHQRGILHRDIKPSNILLDESGEPYVSDFGLAKRIAGADASAQTLSGAVIGTPNYMPPEQACGKAKDLTTAADVYSLGATLYEMLTGQPPFRSDSIPETLRLVVEQDPAPPRTINPTIDTELETVCLKCLEKAPIKRYASAKLLAGDLTNWLEGKPLEARPVSFWGRWAKWARRSPLVATLLALCAVALLSLAIGGAWFTWQLSRTLASAELRLFVADMLLASEAWTEKKVTRTLELLGEHEPDRPGGVDRRGWEWFYLRGLCDPEIRALSGHTDNVLSVAFSPDDRYLASAGTDRTIRIWETATGQRVQVLTGHDDAVNSVAFGPRGDLLVSGSADRTVKIWDLATRHWRAPMTGHADRVNTVAISPDGRLVASGSEDATIRLWDTATGQLIRTMVGHQQAINSVAFSPDGKRLASVGWDENINIWEVGSERPPQTAPERDSLLSTVRFSPEGNRLLVAGGDGAVRIWNFAEGSQPRRFGLEHAHNRAQAFSSDGTMFVSVNGRGEVEIWDVDNWGQIYTLPEPVNLCHGLALSNDLRHLALTSGKQVLLGKIVIKKQTPTLKGPQSALTGLALHRDGRHVASAGEDGSIVIWDIREQRSFPPIQGGSGPISRIVYSTDGRHLAWLANDGTIMLRPVGEDRAPAVLRGRTGAFTAMAFSPVGARLAAATSTPELTLWDVATAQPIPILFPRMTGSIAALAYSREGRLLAVAGGAETVWVCDASSGRAVTEFLADFWISAIAFSPDGQFLAAGGGKPGKPGEIRVWQLAGGRLVCTCRGHTDVVRCLTFSPEGNRLISGSTDQTIKVWELIGGQETISLREHSGPIQGLAFSPDRRQLFSASSDGMIKIWDAPAVAAGKRPRR